jgi:hypothetical protein
MDQGCPVGPPVLSLAVKAQLPLIGVTTRDTLNLPEVIHRVTGRKPVDWATGPSAIKTGSLYLHVCSKATSLPYPQLYAKLVKAEASLVVVNSPKPHELVFNAAEVPVPKAMMLEFLAAVVDAEAKAKGLLPALGGCTIKEAAELVRLTMARDHSLTAKGLMLTRKTAFQGSQGLMQVDTAQSYYDPPAILRDWVQRERPFFLDGKDPRLVPRGLLLDGPPGTGKTEGAKYIAGRFEVPLYRVDIGGVKAKWVGESESNMLSALSQLDHEEPCVALLDEVEKVFSRGSGDHSGVTSSLLSQLLWWLAERRSRVLVVLTTNDRQKLPRELYRAGRIDEVMWFGGLQATAALQFAKRVLETFPTAKKLVGESELQAAVQQLVQATAKPASEAAGDAGTVSQAAVTKLVYCLVKEVSGK